MPFLSWRLSIVTRETTLRRGERLSSPNSRPREPQHMTDPQHHIAPHPSREPRTVELTPKATGHGQPVTNPVPPTVTPKMIAPAHRSERHVTKPRVKIVPGHVVIPEADSKPPPGKPRMPKPAHTSLAKRPEAKHGFNSSLFIMVVTYGQSYNQKYRVEGAETIVKVDCSRLTPPLDSVCHRYTGLDAPVMDDFFLHADNRALFREKLHEIESFLDANPKREGCVAVMVSCVLGVHRSVAMAELLAAELRRRNGIQVETEHRDLPKWVKAKEVSRPVNDHRSRDKRPGRG